MLALVGTVGGTPSTLGMDPAVGVVLDDCELSSSAPSLEGDLGWCVKSGCIRVNVSARSWTARIKTIHERTITLNDGTVDGENR